MSDIVNKIASAIFEFASGPSVRKAAASGTPRKAKTQLKDATDEIARLRLTNEEREAIASCIEDDMAATAYERADTLRGLLERLT